MAPPRSFSACSSTLIMAPLLCLMQTSRISLAKPMPRIINGENAEEGAYPFFASLTQGGEHSCGGTLIAPDMILTAAHCKGLEQAELGRDVRVDPNDEYETFDLIQEFRHPAYSDETYLFDFMVVKLDRPAPSSYPIIRLNQDREQPPIGVPDGVKAIGFGVTEYYYDGSHNGAAGILQEVDLHVITNEECEKSRGTGNIQDEYTAGYDGLITPDMLCAEDDFQDTCAGDSGGPLMMQEWNEFLQVGITSWGYGCNGEFPGVYSRVSHQYHWIKMNVCQNSVAPPDIFECDAPTLPPAQDIEVTIAITFDDFPSEISFSLIDDTNYGALVIEQGQGSFTDNEVQSIVYLTVALKERSTYTFKIDDAGGDGLCCYKAGSYIVYAGTEGNQGEILAAGQGNFGVTNMHQFTIGEGGEGNVVVSGGNSVESNLDGDNGSEGSSSNVTTPTIMQNSPAPSISTETLAPSPVQATPSPTMSPTWAPTKMPTSSPTVSPLPTVSPTLTPTPSPTKTPTTKAPTEAPTPIPLVSAKSQRNQIIYGVAIVVVVAAMFLATSWYADRHNRIDTVPDNTLLIKSDETEQGDEEEFGDDPLQAP